MRLSPWSHLLSTALRITGVLAILVACVVALLILAGPWGMYELGLSNIDGRRRCWKVTDLTLSSRANPTPGTTLGLRRLFSKEDLPVLWSVDADCRIVRFPRCDFARLQGVGDRARINHGDST